MIGKSMLLFRPVSALLLCASFVFISCDKNEEAEVVVPDTPEEVDNGNGNGNGNGSTTYPITGQCVFSCTMSTGDYLFKEDDADREVTFGNYDFTAPTRRSFECRFFDSTEYETQAAVSMRYLEYSGADPTDDAFNAFFTPGEHPIAGLMTPGIVIYMWKPEWNAPKSSDLVLSQPADAHFTVTNVQPFDDGSGVAKVKVRATFKCNISTGTGGTTLSNGIFVGVFGKID